MNRPLSVLLILCLAALPAWAQTAAPDSAVRQVWQQIDYVGVDYAGAVSHGKVIRESEFAEMREFAGNALSQAKTLPPTSGREDLIAAVSALDQAVEQRSEPSDVGRLARRAAELLLTAYPIPVAPKTSPDLARGVALYQAQCASCHGSTGRADGPLSAQLEPKPVAFANRDRARARSVLALYQILSQGVPGTSMPSFATLPESDRWALAFYAGTLSHDQGMRERGAAIWKDDPAAKAQFPDLAALTTASELTVSQRLGEDRARDVTAFLRSDPQALTAAHPGGVSLARSQLKASLTAARSGDFASATQLGLSAYLDGFEPVEPTLGARNRPLMIEVEQQMLGYRAALASNKVEEAAAAARRLDGLFARVETELGATAADPMTTFIGSLTILLREGVEALLVVVGMLAFLRKAQRSDVIRLVHAGWISALLAGGLTWAIATFVVGISGASREVTEGVSSLFAAIVLLGVGLWMHQKSSAGRWQAYLKDKLSAAMSQRSAWALFGLAFIAVYREVFETVLFYSALAADGNGGALAAGLAAGILVLGVVAWLLLRTSARMPIGKFFAVGSVLVAVLAVVLAGKGVAGLQEAGWLSASPIAAPRIQVLGLFPSAETVIAQLVVVAIAAIGFWFNAVAGRRAAGAVQA